MASLLFHDNLVRANTSVGGAGTTTGAGNGLIDRAGSVWHISSNTLVAAGGDFNSNLLCLPASFDRQDTELSILTDVASGVGMGVLWSRENGSGTEAYRCFINSQILYRSNVNGGSAGFNPDAVRVVPDGEVIFRQSALNTDGTHTTQVCAVYDPRDNSGVALVTITNAGDTRSQLQVSGVNAISALGSGAVKYIELRNPASSTRLTAKEWQVPASSSSQRIRLTRTGGSAWTIGSGGSTFSLTSTGGASIVSQTVDTTSTATLIVNTGTAEGLTVTDTVNSEDAIVLVRSFTPANRLAVFVGDSQTNGGLSPASDRYPYKTASLLTSTLAINLGISGGGIDDLTSAYSTAMGARYDSTRSSGCWLIIWIGTNNLQQLTKTPAQVQTGINTLCSSGRADGYKTLVITCLPRSDAFVPSYEANRATLNGTINAMVGAGTADVVVDFNTNSAVFGDSTNTTYYSDGVHGTTARQLVQATMVSDAITAWETAHGTRARRRAGSSRTGTRQAIYY